MNIFRADRITIFSEYKNIPQIVKAIATKYKSMSYFLHKDFYQAVNRHVKSLYILLRCLAAMP